MSQIAVLMESPRTFAVVGVSQDPTKYGYELFEILTKHGHTVLPVNPKYDQIDGQPCYPSLAALPKAPDAVVSAISPSGAAKLAETCVEQKITVLWMPPGTDSEEALQICQSNQITAFHGICPIFVLNMPRDRWKDLP